MYSAQRLTSPPRHTNLNQTILKPLHHMKHLDNQNSELSSPSKPLDASPRSQSSKHLKNKFKKTHRHSNSLDLDKIKTTVPTEQSQNLMSIKKPLRDYLTSLYKAETNNGKTYNPKPRQTVVPYVINRNEFKKMPAHISIRTGNLYKNLSERNRLQKNLLEINKLRALLSKDLDKDRAVCLSFMQKHTHESFDEDQIASFIQYINRNESISPCKTMKELILQCNIQSASMKSSTNTQLESTLPCGYSSTSRFTKKDISRCSSQNALKPNNPGLNSTSQLDIRKFKKLGSPWELSHFPYKDSYKRNSLLLENVMLQRLNSKNKQYDN